MRLKWIYSTKSLKKYFRAEEIKKVNDEKNFEERALILKYEIKNDLQRWIQTLIYNNHQKTYLSS